MITIKKLNKNYGKRRIKVFDEKTYLGQITTWMDWICMEKNYSKSVVKTNVEIKQIEWAGESVRQTPDGVAIRVMPTENKADLRIKYNGKTIAYIYDFTAI